MNQLFVWTNTLGRKLKGIPQNSITWLLDYKPKGDLNDNSIKGNWISFNPHRDELPLIDDLKLPSILYLYIKIKNTPVFDWYYIHHHIMAVSEEFLNFLLENNLKEQIEIAELKIFNTEEIELKERKYFAIRIIKFNDNEFNFNENIKKRAAGVRGRFMYPEMELNAQDQQQNIFFLLEFCYNETLILTEKAKNYILSNFYNPEIYKIEDYPLVFNNSNSLDGLPNNVVL